MNPHVKEMVEGRGYKIIKVDYVKVHRENKDVDIDSVGEAQAVMKAQVIKMLGMDDNPLTPIFECAELNNRGYPIDARYAFQICKKTNRMQAVVPRPLVSGSNKTLVDDSTESRLWRLAIGIINTMINDGADFKYVVQALTILMSTEFAREQMRHHDLEAYYDDELKKTPGISIVIPIDYKAAVAIWGESHKYVQIAKKMEAKGTADYNIMSEFRELAAAEGIEVKELEKTTEYFGEEEMLMVLDNTIHAGAKNASNRAVFRLHIYATIEGTQANTAATNIPASVVWDLTRKGADSEDFYSTMVKVLDGDSYKGDDVFKNKNVGKGVKPRKADKPVADAPSQKEPPMSLLPPKSPVPAKSTRAMSPELKTFRTSPREPVKSLRFAESSESAKKTANKQADEPSKKRSVVEEPAKKRSVAEEPTKKRPVGRPRKNPLP